MLGLAAPVRTKLARPVSDKAYKVRMAAGEIFMGGARLFVLATLLCCTAAEGFSHPMKVHKVGLAEAREAAFRQAIEIWQSGRVDLITRLVTPDYVGHPASSDRNVDGLQKRITEFHRLYPDAKFTIEDQVTEGDRVATRLTVVATSSLTGKRVKLVGLNVSRFVGARIAEEWPVWEIVP